MTSFHQLRDMAPEVVVTGEVDPVAGPAAGASAECRWFRRSRPGLAGPEQLPNWPGTGGRGDDVDDLVPLEPVYLHSQRVEDKRKDSLRVWNPSMIAAIRADKPATRQSRLRIG